MFVHKHSILEADDVPEMSNAFDDIEEEYAQFATSNAGIEADEIYKLHASIKWTSLNALLQKNDGIWSSKQLKDWVAHLSKDLPKSIKKRMMKNLKKSAEKAKNKALAEVPVLKKQERKLKIIINKPEPQMEDEETQEALKDMDLVVLDPGDAEYISAATALSSSGGQNHPPITCIKKVILPARLNSFKAYAKGLQSSGAPIHSTQVFHGTPQVDWANSIARNGPDISRAGSNVGKVYGAGFYSAEVPQLGYAGTSGSMLLCDVTDGRICTSGNGSTTASTLAAMSPPCHSVVPGNSYHILFHPE